MKIKKLILEFFSQRSNETFNRSREINFLCGYVTRQRSEAVNKIHNYGRKLMQLQQVGRIRQTITRA